MSDVETIDVNGKPFVCTKSQLPYIADVFEGEFSLTWPVELVRVAVPALPKRPKILDINARIGAFSVWAHLAYEPKSIEAYTFDRREFDFFVDNTKHHNMVVECKNLDEVNQLPDRYDTDILKISLLPGIHISKFLKSTSKPHIIIVEIGEDKRSIDDLIRGSIVLDRDETGNVCFDDLYELYSGYLRSPFAGVLRFRKRTVQTK